MQSKALFLALSAAATLALSGCGSSSDSNNDGGSAAITSEQKLAVLTTYADIALANYTDAYTDAVALKTAVDAFAAAPTDATFAAAKTAWLASRESYGTTEIFRLSEGPIDGEEGWVATAYGALEGQINAWPLDENMIDYTTAADGTVTSGNIIDTTGSFTPAGTEATAVDVTTLTVDALTALNENGGEANVATGYHAIEFLLWGQDQDYNSFVADTVTNGALTAGQRVLTDYTTADNADRRAAYLQAAADKLVSDLEVVKNAWSTTASTNCDSDATGCYRAALLGQLTGGDASKNIDADAALKTIMSGMGVFLYSELANERIAVAVLTPSEEDEHSCFSDNTHRDIVLNYTGFMNVLKGEYEGSSKGTGMYTLLSSDLKAEIDTLDTSIMTTATLVDTTAKTEKHFDYQIMPADPMSTSISAMKTTMRNLGNKMVDVAAAFDITLTEDDVKDPDETRI